MTDTRPPAARWVHADCEGVVLFDLSGGYCLTCQEEGLGKGDCSPVGAAAR